MSHLRQAVAARVFTRAAERPLLRRIAGGPIKRLIAAMPVPEPPVRPVLLVGCHRSGTTVLYEALARSPELALIGDEGHTLWEAFHHPSRHGWRSNELGVSDVSQDERKYLYRIIRGLSGNLRFLEKTPTNCLRIPYLNELFPDASFVFLRRRAADNVNSLIEGRRASPRFVTYRLPEPLERLGELRGDAWSFALVPGWRKLKHAPSKRFVPVSTSSATKR